MKKRVLYLLCMAFAMMAWLPPQLWAQTQPSGGDGSSESPFLIATAEELKWYASYVNGESGDNVVHTTACAKLMNDIDLSTVCGEGKGTGRRLLNTAFTSIMVNIILMAFLTETATQYPISI